MNILKKKIILLLIGLVACLSFSFTFKASYGALSQDWIAIADFKNEFPTDLDIDSLGNIYVAGSMDNYNGTLPIVDHEFSIFLLKYDSLGAQQWNRTYQISERDICNDLVLDNQDNIYLVGYTYLDDHGLLLMKYNSSGHLQWNKTWGKYAGGTSIKIDSYNNILVIGTRLNDISLQKYDSSGNLLWNRTWETPEHDKGVSIDLDSSNNIYIGGTTNTSGIKDVILVKYNSLGEFQWNLTCKIPEDVCCNDVIIDTLDNIYILGQVYGASSDYGMWLLKYDNSGSFLWNVTWGEWGTYSIGNGIALDASDNIYITGSTRVSGSDNILVLKYDSTGDLKWNYTQGVRDYNTGMGIKIDSSENIFICGLTNSIESSFTEDAFLLKLSKAESSQAFVPGYNLPIVLLSVFGTGIAFYIKKRKSFLQKKF